MLNVLIPCCKHDQHLVVMLLEWIAEMGKVDAPMFLLCDNECSVQHLMELADKAFTSTKWLKDYENIKSDWSSDKPGAKSAAGPNSLFRQAVWHFAGSNAGPWLFLEPDAIPCRPDWLTVLDKQYHEKGKPFMGFLVSRETHPGVTAQHMSGVAIYPANSPAYFRKSILSSPTAFDIATAESVLPHLANTNLIFHRYRPPTFDSQKDFDERVTREVALWHACKDGSIFSFLRKRLGMVREDQSEDHLPSKQVAAGSTPVAHSNVWEFRNGQLQLVA
jgi:hypothetical protein